MRSSILLGALAAVLLSGCGRLNPIPVGYDLVRLGPAADTIVAAGEALGGVKAWRGNGANTMALVTTYDDAGEKYVNVQSQVIDAVGGHIAATAKTNTGRWRASYTSGGFFWLSNAKALDGMSSPEMEQTLATILHRFAGPFNIVAGRERAGEPEQVWLEGKTLVRVPVAGQDEPLTYYFDAATGLLQMVTAGADEPGRDGTVTFYTYQMLPSGLTVPRHIRVVRIGRHVLVGPTPVIDVEFAEVRMD